MKQLTYLLPTGLMLAVLGGCGSSGGGGTIAPGDPIAKPDQIPLLIESLQSGETFANRFAVNQCKKLGPEAIEALPALQELRTRKANDLDLVAKIDAAIAAIEGGGDAAATP